MKSSDKSRNETNNEDLEQAYENTEPLMEAGKSLADASISMAAKESGRTAEEQLERMGDHFTYLAMQQDPDQKQLDDYELSGETVPVKA